MKHRINDLIYTVLDERRNTYKSLRTAAWEKQICKRTLDYFENIFIEDVDEHRLIRFFSFLRVKDDGSLYSDKYIKAVFSVIKAVFRKAVIRGYITINPMDYDFKRPKGTIPISKERLISDSDIKALFKPKVENALYDTVFKVLLLTGLRIGELLGLFWSDIDFDEKIIHVCREAAPALADSFGNTEYIRTGMTLSTPKTQSSVRDIPVSDYCLSVLKNWLVYRDRPEQSKWKAVIIEKNNLRLVFPNQIGNITDYSLLRQGFVEYCRLNGVKGNISFHKFRHTYATNLLSAGVDIAVVSSLLGHSNIETTANIYCKVEMKPKLNAVKMQDKYIRRQYCF